MLTRREILRILGAAGVTVPVLSGCVGGVGATPPVAAGPGALRLVSSDLARTAGDTGAVPGVASAMGAFATNLWGRLGPADQNLALSPYSIAVALAMTTNGAAGATRAQMQDVLHIDSLTTYNGGIDALTQEIEGLAGPVKLPDGSSDEIELAAANQLFGDRDTEFGKAFLAVLAQQYGAGMRTVDFRNATEASRVLINRWTADQTHDRIPTILAPGVVDGTTRLVLVNALYFKAAWADPFETSMTQAGTFSRPGGSAVSVPMMKGAPDGATYVEGSHFQAARIPYVDGTLAMTVALPVPGHEHEALAELLADGLTAQGGQGVELTLPRWTFRTPTDLRQVLIDLGMPLAFGDRADFGPMSPTDPLYISDVLHQAFVAVDEHGTEAAAATAVVMDETTALAVTHPLVFDRPFLFVVHDTAHGTPLFIGRVADPS